MRPFVQHIPLLERYGALLIKTRTLVVVGRVHKSLLQHSTLIKSSIIWWMYGTLLWHGSGGSGLLKLGLYNYVVPLDRHGVAVDVTYRAAATAV